MDKEKIDPLADDTPVELPATDSTTPPEIAAELDKEKIDPLADDTPVELPATDSAIPPEIAAELDEEEQEFRALRRDLPGVKGASAAGTVTISVGKAPSKNEFFRAHPDFRPIMPLVDTEVVENNTLSSRPTWSNRSLASASVYLTAFCTSQ